MRKALINLQKERIIYQMENNSGNWQRMGTEPLKENNSKAGPLRSSEVQNNNFLLAPGLWGAILPETRF